MTSPNELPPPPPAPDERPWNDRAGLLDARARAMGALARWYLAPHRALLLWLSTIVFALGWTLAVSGFQFLVKGEIVEHVLGVIFLGLALGATVPSSLGVVSGIRRDVFVGACLRDWAELERDPQTLPHWRVSGGALLWLGPSIVLTCLGLVLGGAAVFTDGGDGFGTEAGIGIVFTAAGGLGMAKAIDYYRLVSRELGPGTGGPETGGAGGGGACFGGADSGGAGVGGAGVGGRGTRGPDTRGPDTRGPDTRGPDTRGPDTRGPDNTGYGDDFCSD
ncbi:hypothetical protein [Streptomyces hygroscopicus]|uniref:hypothetical protein n=1 Tax=Streptomyces hygroscopicus TaxID=1912 RepID=UPI0007853B23|nr:hypothetical protein [Streptomyces hygroscopicus]